MYVLRAMLSMVKMTTLEIAVDSQKGRGISINKCSSPSHAHVPPLSDMVYHLLTSTETPLITLEEATSSANKNLPFKLHLEGNLYLMRLHISGSVLKDPNSLNHGVSASPWLVLPAIFAGWHT